MENEWVSFEEVKKSVTLEMAINRYGVKLKRVNATTLRGRCPLPSHGSEKSKESFIATLNKGAGGVWACQSKSCVAGRAGHIGGNVLDFVSAMEGCSVRDAALKLHTWFMVHGGLVKPEPTTPQPPPTELASRKRDGGGTEEDEVNKPLTFTLQGINPDHPYLASRGILPETAATFGVGYFPGKGSMAGRVVIPVHNEDGQLVAYAGRLLDSAEPKYKFPPGFHKSQVLFNLNRAGDQKTIVLVEGFFDCMNVHQAGFPAVALMGSSMSAAQAELLCNRFSGVVLLLDGDETGQKATEECLLRLGRRVWVRSATLGAKEQPDTLTTDEIKALLIY